MYELVCATPLGETLLEARFSCTNEVGADPISKDFWFLVWVGLVRYD